MHKTALFACALCFILSAICDQVLSETEPAEENTFGTKIHPGECDKSLLHPTRDLEENADFIQGPAPYEGLKLPKKKNNTQNEIQEKINRLEDLKRQQEALEEEISQIKLDIGNVLIDEDVTIKSSFVSKRLVKGNYTYKENVHIMVIPVAEAIEKQLMVLLREREKDLTNFLDVVQNNIDMMESTVELVEDLVNFGADQVSLVFGETSAFNQIFISGFTPLIDNMDSIFGALENLIDFKRNTLDTFLSDNYDRNKLLKNIGDIAVKDIIPAKVNFAMTLLNNSDSIRSDLDNMMYHMGNLITLKQSVIDSVTAYIEQNRNIIQNTLGREFRFDTFFRDLQSGNLFTNITVGPFARTGLFFDRTETRSIIRHYISMLNPKLPLLDSPVKEILVDKDEIRVVKGPLGQTRIDEWLSKRLSDIIVDSYYKFSVKNGDMYLSTTSPPLHLGTSCGLNFVLGSSTMSLRLRRTSQIAITKGLTYGTGRTPSLDLIVSAWLDSDLNLAGRGIINLSKNFIAKCYNKVKQKANVHIVARAKTFISMKVSVTEVSIQSRPVESDIFVPSYIVGKTLPHIVLRFVLSLNSELSFLSLDHLKLSDCDVNVFGVKVSSYCNILERMILSQSKEALKQSLPLSSYRAMRQIERAIFRRFGNEIYIPLYIDDQRPVESFLLTADNVINVGKKLSDDITQLVNQMSEVENTFMHFY